MHSCFQEINEPSVQIKLDVRNPDTQETTPTAFSLSAEKLRLLIHGRYSESNVAAELV